MDGRLDAAAVGELDGARAGLRQAQGGDLSGGQAQGLAEASGKENWNFPLLPVRTLDDDGYYGALVRADSADDHSRVSSLRGTFNAPRRCQARPATFYNVP